MKFWDNVEDPLYFPTFLLDNNYNVMFRSQDIRHYNLEVKTEQM